MLQTMKSQRSINLLKCKTRQDLILISKKFSYDILVIQMFVCDEGIPMPQTKLAFFLSFKPALWPFSGLFAAPFGFLLKLSPGNSIQPRSSWELGPRSEKLPWCPKYRAKNLGQKNDLLASAIAVLSCVEFLCSRVLRGALYFAHTGIFSNLYCHVTMESHIAHRFLKNCWLKEFRSRFTSTAPPTGGVLLWIFQTTLPNGNAKKVI